MPLVLASASPRRRQLLEAVGIPFRVLEPRVEETVPADLPVMEVARFLSQKKAWSLATHLEPDEVLVAADTCVLLNGNLLGKPASVSEAIGMLQALSGNRHEVITGVTLLQGGRMRSFSEQTSVWFRPLAEPLICYYVTTFAPLDKAGAYGIQEFIGYVGVQSIQGCFYNVMGLPISRLLAELEAFGWPWYDNLKTGSSGLPERFTR